MAHGINGAHVIVYSTDADADRAFLRDVLEFDCVDAGEGWLIFALPPAEAAVHPADRGGAHQLYLMTDDLEQTTASLVAKGVDVAPPSDEGWGILTSIGLPGGDRLGLYQPRHAKPRQD